MESPRRGIAVALGGGLAAGLSLVVIFLLWGPEAIRSLVAGRQWKALYLAQNIQRGLPVLALPLAAALAGAPLLARRGPARLVLLYVMVSLATGLLTGGGAGVYYNCFFDLAVASCLAAGLAVTHAMESTRYRGAWLLPAALTLGAMTLSIRPLLTFRWDVMGGDAAALAATTAGDVARIAAVRGPVACETAALCYWAGKDFEVDFFNARQALLTGRAGEDNLLSLLRQRKFDLVQLQDRAPGSRLSPAAAGEMGVLDSNYVEVHQSATGLYLVPRR
jgi:hypothetical protein